MDSRYQDYFRERLQQEPIGMAIRGDVALDDVRRVVQAGIDAADLPREVDVRPDAVALLVLNLHEMVLLPIAAVEEGLTPSFVNEELPADVTTIVRTAAEQAVGKGERAISAHDILSAVDATWPTLAFAAPWRWEGDVG